MATKKSNKRRWVIGILVFLFVAYIYYEGWYTIPIPERTPIPEEYKPKPKSTTPKKARFWKRYDPSLKARIDKLNCTDLQKEFNTADRNSDMQRARTGEGNLELMEYIDNRLQKKGCY